VKGRTLTLSFESFFIGDRPPLFALNVTRCASVSFLAGRRDNLAGCYLDGRPFFPLGSLFPPCPRWRSGKYRSSVRIFPLCPLPVAKSPQTFFLATALLPCPHRDWEFFSFLLTNTGSFGEVQHLSLPPQSCVVMSLCFLDASDFPGPTPRSSSVIAENYDGRHNEQRPPFGIYFWPSSSQPSFYACRSSRGLAVLCFSFRIEGYFFGWSSCFLLRGIRQTPTIFPTSRRVLGPLEASCESTAHGLRSR